jgi:hypothetical protein
MKSHSTEEETANKHEKTLSMTGHEETQIGTGDVTSHLSGWQEQKHVSMARHWPGRSKTGSSHADSREESMWLSGKVLSFLTKSTIVVQT